MDGKQIKIWYLRHSGFAVETQEHFIVFDYSSDSPQRDARCLDNGAVSSHDLEARRNIFVFVSHSHSDHFNPVIYEWIKANPNIKYILSYDIRDDIQLVNKNAASERPNFYFIFPYQEIKIGSVRIKTYGSTDIGVSFLVEVDGFYIFHAGDLNCWYWYYESTLDELEEDQGKFIKEIERIKGEKIDIAFFPVDPRLKEYCHMGGEYFIKAIKPKLFIPMHFWDQYPVTKEFADKVKDLPAKVITLWRRGQQIIYNKPTL
ncbi:MAG: MBL fold metallo-hydrolase [Firmicutes bacterium]|nr:MBL fold metallo-hydrolase [Bacillota bacterium]